MLLSAVPDVLASQLLHPSPSLDAGCGKQGRRGNTVLKR